MNCHYQVLMLTIRLTTPIKAEEIGEEQRALKNQVIVGPGKDKARGARKRTRQGGKEEDKVGDEEEDEAGEEEEEVH